MRSHSLISAFALATLMPLTCAIKQQHGAFASISTEYNSFSTDVVSRFNASDNQHTFNNKTQSITIVLKPSLLSPRANTYTVKSGDTLVTIAQGLGITEAALEDANVGINPNILTVGEVLNIPGSSSNVPINSIVGDITPTNVYNPITNSNPTPTSTGGKKSCRTPGANVEYSGPASAFPPPSKWATYSFLWAQNAVGMESVNTPSEMHAIAVAIATISKQSSIDPRIILCVMMQESGGFVRVQSTSSWEGILNTGLMQANHGAVFDAKDPSGSIMQMIKDGAMETASGFGLMQAYKEYGNWYEAFRKYNSGRVNKDDLGDGLGATPSYVSSVANKLMGHGNGYMVCESGVGHGGGSESSARASASPTSFASSLNIPFVLRLIGVVLLWIVVLW